LIVRRVASELSELEEEVAVGVWNIINDAPAPSEIPLARVRLPPARSVVVAPASGAPACIVNPCPGVELLVLRLTDSVRVAVPSNVRAVG